jgi:hypothetical protein
MQELFNYEQPPILQVDEAMAELLADVCGLEAWGDDKYGGAIDDIKNLLADKFPAIAKRHNIESVFPF